MGQWLVLEAMEVKLAILYSHSRVAVAIWVFLEAKYFTSLHQPPDSWSHLL